MLKKFIILFVIGIIVVITGVLMKIGNEIQNIDLLLAFGLILELVAVIGLIRVYLRSKKE